MTAAKKKADPQKPPSIPLVEAVDDLVEEAKSNAPKKKGS